MIRGGYWGGAWGLSWAGTWGEAWLLLNQPYQDLSLKGQVFVRSYLTSIHSVEVAERIVSVAALNNISVIDAETAILSKHASQAVIAKSQAQETRINAAATAVSVVEKITKRKAFSDTPQAVFSSAKQRRITATHSAKNISSQSGSATVDAQAITQQLFVLKEDQHVRSQT